MTDSMPKKTYTGVIEKRCVWCRFTVTGIEKFVRCCPIFCRARGTYPAYCPGADWERDVYGRDGALPFKADYDGTTDKGNTAATAVITAHPEIKKWLVTGANEEGCVGAARALESAGLDADACVVGLGAYMAKDEFKKEGGSCMKASAYFSADSVGAGSVNVLMDIINGKEPVMETAGRSLLC